MWRKRHVVELRTGGLGVRISPGAPQTFTPINHLASRSTLPKADGKRVRKVGEEEIEEQMIETGDVVLTDPDRNDSAAL
jgi:hypothetical protein